MGVSRGGAFIALGVLDDAGQRDTPTGERVLIGARRDDRDTRPRIRGEIAAMFCQVGDAQHRSAAEQAVGDERRPRITVGGQRRECARIRRRGDCARFFCR
jgi:hypothetical protein